VIQPDFTTYPQTGFPEPQAFHPSVLAITDTGSFTSFFKGKDDPRIEKIRKAHEERAAKKDRKEDEKHEEEVLPPPLIERSPDGTRLVVVGCSEFVNDTVISISRSLSPDRFLNSLQFVQNLVDWSVEDEDLLTIRAREGHARLLRPMDHSQQRFYEILNYCLAFGGLLVVAFLGHRIVRNEKPMELLDQEAQT
jgi:ABC-2 type transport system permease protein